MASIAEKVQPSNFSSLDDNQWNEIVHNNDDKISPFVMSVVFNPFSYLSIRKAVDICSRDLLKTLLRFYVWENPPWE